VSEGGCENKLTRHVLAMRAITPTFAIFLHFCHDLGFSSGKSSMRRSYILLVKGHATRFSVTYRLRLSLFAEPLLQ
jgi:hypothetical protein